MSNRYRKNFMPEGYYGTCAKTCIMGILNYFYYSYFNTQDFDNIFKMMNFGHKKSEDIPELLEIAYFFDRLKFDVSYFTSISSEDFDKMLHEDLNTKLEVYQKYLNPKFSKYVKGNHRIEEGHNIDMEIFNIPYLDLIKSNNTINFIHSDDIEDFITKNQKDEGVLFLLGLDSHMLYNYEQTDDSISGGHVVISKGIIDNKFEIYEPGYPAPEAQYFDKNLVLSSMKTFGDIQIVLVKEKNY